MAFVVLLAAALVAQLVSAGVVVNQYEGPTDCDRKTGSGDFLTFVVFFFSFLSFYFFLYQT